MYKRLRLSESLSESFNIIDDQPGETEGGQGGTPHQHVDGVGWRHEGPARQERAHCSTCNR